MQGGSTSIDRTPRYGVRAMPLAEEQTDPMLSPSWAPSKLHAAPSTGAHQAEALPSVSLFPSAGSSDTDHIFPSAEKTSRRRRRRQRNCWSWPWTGEILAMGLALVALASIPATILPHHDKPVPQWPISISINTLLAVYAAILKACLAFVIHSSLSQLAWVWFGAAPRPLHDLVRLQDAGSGGWGSWAWLWPAPSRHLARQQPLVVLGALMAILTVFTDPFVQQLVRPRDCRAESSRALPASLPRTSYFNRGNMTPDFKPGELLPGLQDAIVDSAFGTPDVLQGECRTGNCTFPEFSSMAYCSACDDVSSSLSFRYACRDPHPDINKFPDPNATREDFPLKWSRSPKALCKGPVAVTGGVVSSRLRSGHNTSSLWDYGGRQILDSKINFVTSRWYGGRLLQDGPSTYEIVVGKTPFSVHGIDPITGQPLQGCDAKIGPGEDAGQDEDHDEGEGEGEGDWRCRGYGAAMCSLHPCVRTYQTSVQNGIVIEQTISQTTLQDIEPLAPLKEGTELNLLVDTKCASASDLQQLAQRGLDVDRKRWVALSLARSEFEPNNATFSTFPGSLFSNKCAFMWTMLANSALHDFLRGNHFLEGSINGSTTKIGIGSDTELNYYFPYVLGSREMLRMYHRNDITFAHVRSVFEDMASGLTNYIRTHGHENYSEPQMGTSWHYAICLEIRWPWIAMPAALWLGVAAALCYSIVSTSRAGVPVWKASPLPLVFRGPLDHADRREVDDGFEGESETVAGMEKKAEEIVVQLERADGEFGLRRLSANLAKP